MNADTPSNTSFKLFNTGQTGYTQQVPTESPRPTGRSHDGKDIVDLTDDDTQTYHVTSQDLQSAAVDLSRYTIPKPFKTRGVVKITDAEQKAKWKEIAHPKQYTLDSNWPIREIIGCGIFDPRGLIFWGLLVTWTVCVIVPLILFITSFSSDNSAKIQGFGIWLLLGGCLATGITTFSCCKTKYPSHHEIGEIKFALKRRDIYNRYCNLNDHIAEKRLNGSYSKGKIEKWFDEYATKIEMAELEAEDKVVFQHLLNSHKDILSELLLNRNAVWKDNETETIVAENLKHLLCSEDENCRQLAETWAEDFAKFCKSI